MDDLAKVIQSGDIESPSETNTEETLPKEIIRQDEEDRPVGCEEIDITTVSLTQWFKANHKTFDNVNRVIGQVRGVDFDENLWFAILDPKGGIAEDGHRKRNLESFKGSDEFPVLDLPGHSMEVFTNCFIITNPIGDAKFLKCYGVRSGLVVYFCINVEGRLIPYGKTKMRKKAPGIKMELCDTAPILHNLSTPLNKENLTLQYSQIRKSIDDINTKNEAIEWFIQKREGVIDLGHLMKIDDGIMHLTTYSS